ncbi:MAG: DUF1236 domain-containing protein [Hyphomicrobiaceae bacterium]
MAATHRHSARCPVQTTGLSILRWKGSRMFRSYLMTTVAAVALAVFPAAVSAQKADAPSRSTPPGATSGPGIGGDASGGASQSVPRAGAPAGERSATDTRERQPQQKQGQAQDRQAQEPQGQSDRAKQARERGGDDADRAKQARERSGDDADRAKQARERSGDDADRSRQARDGDSNAARSQRRVEFTDQQRQRLSQTIRGRNVRRQHIDVDISIGVRIPRRVALFALPPTFVTYAPRYRDYRYALIDERYVIVDPVTYEIVYVLDSAGPPRQSAGLSLSSGQRGIVLGAIDWDRKVGADIAFAVGEDIPDRIELIRFPEPVLDRVPKLRGYRYVVHERRVAIVNPDHRDVLLVLARR